MGDAIVDIFRLENRKIVEHRDVIRPVPETAANPNTMFSSRRKPMSETNKGIAVAFYKAVIEGRVEDAFRLYAVPTYRQHNPLIEDGMEGLRKVVTWLTDARCEIKRVFADGDHVIIHSHWHGLSDNPRGEAVVDIFRLEGGKVLEHWDVIQPIPETSANTNMMF